MLLDCVDAAGAAAARRLPATGRSPSALRAAGVAHVPIAGAPAASSASRHAARRRSAWRATSGGSSRPFVVAWGARAVLAARARAPPVARRPPRPARPAARSARVVQAATRAAPTASRRPRRRSPTQFGGEVAVLHPGVDLDALHPAARSRTGRRTRSCSARWSGGSGPSSRSRSPRRCPSCTSRSPARRCPATTAPRSRLRAHAERTSRSPAASTTSRRRSPTPTSCCTAPTPSPTGMVLVEALAAGRPVVAPDRRRPAGDRHRRRRPPLPARRRRRRRSQALRAALADPRGPRTPPAAAPRQPSTSATPSPAWTARRVARDASPRSSSCTARAPSSRSCCPRSHADAADRRRHRPRRRRRGARAREHGAEVIERRDNPGFGAANNLGARARHRAGHRPAEPGHRSSTATRSSDSRERARRPGLHAPRLLNADGSVQRSAHPLPGHARRLPARARPPAAAAQPIRERVEPYRARHAAHRRLGDRRLPGRAAPHACSRFDPAHPPVRRGHGPVPAEPAPQGCRRSYHPDLEVTPHRPPQRRATSRSSARARSAATSIERTLRHDARSGSTTPRSCSRSPPARCESAHNDRERAQLDALLNARGPAIPGLEVA